ncbi:MAG: tetratricopeptide repeat protein [Candidatus Auribacterota bacterium]|jgi:tetratricopeptide (TPR) repeat protein|nr:tetratricopeptide repeat protein [Candidatus Auribacterota bacterium]
MLNSRKFWKTILLVMTTASIAFLYGCGPREEDDFFSDSEFTDRDAISEITPQERIEQYKQILEIDPSDYQVRNNLGVIYAQLRLLEEAIEQFKMVIETKPDYNTAILNLGAAYGDMGQLDNAIESFKKAIEVNPGYAKAYQNLGVAYYETKQYEQAIDSFEKFIALQTVPIDESIYYTIAQSYKNLKNKEMVRQYLEKALEVNPNNEQIKENLLNIDIFMTELDNQ